MSLPSSDPLGRALDEAVAGRSTTLFALLERGSRLPVRARTTRSPTPSLLACRARQGEADALALAMARLTADEAPGAGPREFLPVCGLLALGARAATDAGPRGPAVRCRVARACRRLALPRSRRRRRRARAHRRGAAGDSLVDDVTAWMDGYFPRGRGS